MFEKVEETDEPELNPELAAPIATLKMIATRTHFQKFPKKAFLPFSFTLFLVHIFATSFLSIIYS